MIVRLIKLLDKLINVIVLCFFFLCLLIAALGIYDALTVYQGANATNYQQYKKKGVQFDDLLAINSDVMAWLTVKGTHIDYPIVQGENNLEYINKSVEGEYSLSGSVFLDYRNKVTFEDKYSLIYAHHMAGNVMFGELPNFRKKSFFNKHKEFSIETKTKQKLKINIFACIQTDAFDSLLFNPIDV
ncbi:FCT-2 pilus polymerization class B sortase SrtC1, partial [Streptococcus pyogenes]